MSRKLNQILAVEKGVKVRTYATITDLHKVSQVPAVFNGFTKVYNPTDEKGTPQVPQSQKVQYSAESVFDTVKKSLTELFDVTATKDWGNQRAKANVVVDGVTLVHNAPATYLLFLDKQLSDLLALVGKFTELDPATDWNKDPNSALFRSNEVKTFTTNKVQEPLVVVPATEFHPAQVQILTKDVVVGEWNTTKHSGALPTPRKKVLLERIQKLIEAVKVALEEANMTSVDDVKTGDVVLSYIFA